MLISRYFVAFILFSFLGWLWESFLCIITKKHWEKRSFLFGPICPIYGTGAISCFVLLDVIRVLNWAFPEWWQILLISFFGSAVLEYATSVVLEKLFHGLWWDYSGLPLNLNGRICLLASCGFSAAGLVITYAIYPLFNYSCEFISPIIFEVCAMILCVLMTVDLTLTVSALTEVQGKINALDKHINENMTDLVERLYNSISEISRGAVSKIKKVKYKESAQAKIYLKLMEKIKSVKHK